jgi:beta-galactosidase
MVVDYERHARRWHSAAQRLHLAVDIVRGDEDLSAYDLVIAPSLFVVPDATAAALRDYVAAGGRLLVTAFSDVVDEQNAFREGGFTAALRDVLGVAVVEFGALVAPGDQSGPGQDGVTVESPFGSFHAEISTEVLALHGAEVIGRFADGRTAGEPALTVHAYGKGSAHYLATFAGDQGAEVVLAALAELTAPRDVDVSRRGDYVTVVNHGLKRADVPLSGHDAITGASVEGLSLDRFAWAIVRTSEENN